MRHLAWSGLLAIVLNGALVAVFRGSAGEQSRYYYVTVVMLLPVLALWVINVPRWLRGPRGARVVLVAVLLAAYLINALHLQYDQYRIYRATSGQQPALVTGIVSSLDAGERILTSGTGQWFNGDFRADLIGRASFRASLPSVGPTSAGRLDAERWFFVGVGDRSRNLPGPKGIDFGEGFPDPMPLASAGCRFEKDTALSSTFTLPTGNGAEIRVTSGATRVTTGLKRGKLTSGGRVWETSPGTIYVSVTAKDAMLEIILDRDGGDGDVIICS